MPRILVTNDDGHRAAGIAALARALRAWSEVVVVAPAREASGVSHSLTLREPLRLLAEGPGLHVVDGTPGDCVTLAVFHLLRDAPPDLVVAGINHGPNLGEDLHYSGTVAGAKEGAILGFPAIAFSQEWAGVEGSETDLEMGGRVAAGIAERVLREGLPPGVFLNVNLPARAPRGIRVTSQGRRIYREVVEERKDPRGVTYYWIAGTPEWFPEPGSDWVAVRDGYVSITPVRTDLTDRAAGERLAHWNEDRTDGLV